MTGMGTLCFFLAAASAETSGLGGTPPGVPIEIDCAVRTLGWNYGKQLLPERGDFKSLFDALQLHACNLTTPAKDDVYRAPALPVPSGATLYFVSPSLGHDVNNGSYAQPMATIQTAVDAAADALRRGERAAVLLRKGTYHLTSPITLGPQHSGADATSP
eukprot:1864140-Pleurochrysis_carterae.AAC.2